jgi:hypothetical protein
VQVLEKFNWAQKHISDLQMAIDAFRDTNGNHVGKNTDVQTGKVTYFLKSVPEVPNSIALTVGDAIHNLRSTLDHLASAMEVAAGETPDKYTGFPVFDSPEGYRDCPQTKIKGLREPCKRTIDRIQPYKGGNGHRLWQLHQLDIRDKHRILLTVSFVPVARTLTPSERELFERTFSVTHPFNMVAGTERIRRLQAGQELLTVSGEDAKQDMGFAFDVAIDEPGVVEVFPALTFLHLACQEVYRAVNDLGPCL